MAGASRPGTAVEVGPRVHNEGAAAVDLRVLVHGDDTVAAVGVTLEPGESHVVSAPSTASVEVHTTDGSATALAAGAPLFVVRDGRVLVATS